MYPNTQSSLDLLNSILLQQQLSNPEDAYDSIRGLKAPNAAVAFMANLSSTSATNNPVNEVHSNDNQIFDNVDYQLSQEMNRNESFISPMLRLRLMTNYDPVSSVSS
ncbi:hypothetical protein Tco_0592564 [Tanacetum coccineum]